MLGKSDDLTCERLADEHMLAMPLDHAGLAHATNLMIGIVPGILEASRHRSLRWFPSLRGRHLVDRLVWALLVVQRDEATPIGLRSAKFSIFGIRGRDAPFKFMR